MNKNTAPETEPLDYLSIVKLHIILLDHNAAPYSSPLISPTHTHTHPYTVIH